MSWFGRRFDGIIAIELVDVRRKNWAGMWRLGSFCYGSDAIDDDVVLDDDVISR